MKKILLTLFLVLPTLAFGAGLTLPQGGLGTTTIPFGWIVIGQDANRVTAIATSSLGLAVDAFASPNISQWTNNAGYLTSVVTAIATSSAETAGYLPYWTTTSGSPAKLGSVATSSIAVGASISSSGTLGSQVGGTASTLSLNMANANSWTALQTFVNASTTLISADKIFVNGVGTSTFAGNVKVDGNLEVGGVSLLTLVTSGNFGINGTLGVTGAVDFDTFTSALLLTGATGDVAEYTGTSCTNQFIRSLSALGVATCATVGTADVSGLDISDDTNLAVSFPIKLTGDTLSFSGLSTSTAATVSNIPYFSGVNTFANVATTTLTATAPLSLDNPVAKVGGSNSILTCAASSATVAGCLSAANWNTFNNKVGTSSVPTVGQLAYWGSAGTPSTLGSVATSSLAVGASITSSGTLGSQVGGGATTLSLNMANPNSWTALQTFTNSTTTMGNFSTRLWIPTGATQTPTSAGEITIDTTSSQFKYYNGSAKVLGNGNQYATISYATSTAWSATTTIPLGTARVAETWNDIQCFTDVGTLVVRFGDGTNYMANINASTTVGTTITGSNNTFTAGEKRYVDFGTPATSPTQVSCTISKSITAD